MYLGDGACCNVSTHWWPGLALTHSHFTIPPHLRLSSPFTSQPPLSYQMKGKLPPERCMYIYKNEIHIWSVSHAESTTYCLKRQQHDKLSQESLWDFGMSQKNLVAFLFLLWVLSTLKHHRGASITFRDSGIEVCLMGRGRGSRFMFSYNAASLQPSEKTHSKRHSTTFKSLEI